MLLKVQNRCCTSGAVLTQAICIAACYNVEWPLLIVCPSSVTITWLEALYTWLSPKVLPQSQDLHVITSGKVRPACALHEADTAVMVAHQGT